MIFKNKFIITVTFVIKISTNKQYWIVVFEFVGVEGGEILIKNMHVNALSKSVYTSF